MTDIVERLKAAAGQATETNKVTPTRELDQKLYLDAAEEIQRLRSTREWKSASEPPNDARDVLVYGFISQTPSYWSDSFPKTPSGGDEDRAFVARYDRVANEWRLTQNETGTTLVVRDWMEIPE